MQIGGLEPKRNLLDLSVDEKLIGTTDIDFSALEKRVSSIESKQNIILVLVSILVFLKLKDIL